MNYSILKNNKIHFSENLIIRLLYKLIKYMFYTNYQLTNLQIVTKLLILINKLVFVHACKFINRNVILRYYL